MGGMKFPPILGGANMAFSVTLYTFSKKVNSTAQPSSGTTHDCRIKQPCGVLSPSISLNLGLTSSPAAYNYAYIPTFNRFYFIREWTFENALWTASMEVDALASWRGSIGASSCYVLRAANDFNGQIIDNMYPCLSTTVLQESQETPSPWVTDDLTHGTFIIGVAGESTTYYMMDSAELKFFFDSIFSDVYAAGLVGNWAGVFPSLKAQCNPLQYITSIMWFPIALTGTKVTSIKVGWVDVPCEAAIVDGSGIMNGLSSWTLRRHPQAETRGGYLNCSPYTDYMLFYPPFGTIHLDADCLANSTTINAQWNVDLKTGGATMLIACGDSLTDNTHIISWVHSQVGVNYQVSQVVNKGFGAGNLVAPLVAAGVGAYTGNYAGAAITGLSAVGDAAAAKIPTATTIGSNGGIDSLRGIPALQYEFKAVAGADNANLGRPLCETRQISTLGGYIKVMNAYISIAATQEEKEKIKAFMEGGFYYE